MKYQSFSTIANFISLSILISEKRETMFENVRNQNSIRGIYLSDLFISRVEVVLAGVYVHATIVNAADKIMHTGAQIRAILQEYRRPVTINQQRCEPLSLLAYLSNKSLSIIPLT